MNLTRFGPAGAVIAFRMGIVLMGIVLMGLVFLMGTVVSASPAHASPRGVWPIRPPVLVAGFAPPAIRWQAGHRGIDLAATSGEPVSAAADGVVSFAAVLAGRGVVVVDHGALRTTYEPVRASVRVGTYVRAGQVIGVIDTGSGHCGDGHCLHWGLRRGDRYLDPRILLGLRPVLKNR